MLSVVLVVNAVSVIAPFESCLGTVMEQVYELLSIVPSVIRGIGSECFLVFAHAEAFL